MSTQDQNAIRDQVREAYASFARRQSTALPEPQATSCCGPSATAEPQLGAGAEQERCNCDNRAANLYGVESVMNLPANVTDLSAGCGDPVTIASLRPGETVLDLGSGGGIDCFLAARQVGETGHVIGVDMTPEMIATANANKVKLGATNVEFRQGYIEDLPVENDSVDVIISNCVINLSPDKGAVFREIARVLKPGGRVSVSDIVTEGTFDDELRQNMSLWAGCIAGAIDVEEYTGLMREAGLVDVEVVDRVYSDPPEEMRVAGSGKNTPRIFSARITARKPQPAGESAANRS